VEGNGRRKARGRDDSSIGWRFLFRREARGRADRSTHWVFCSAGRPGGGRIAPVTGSPGTLRDPRNFKGASCSYPMVE